jgi:hypothetical protein
MEFYKRKKIEEKKFHSLGHKSCNVADETPEKHSLIFASVEKSKR